MPGMSDSGQVDDLKVHLATLVGDRFQPIQSGRRARGGSAGEEDAGEAEAPPA